MQTEKANRAVVRLDVDALRGAPVDDAVDRFRGAVGGAAKAEVGEEHAVVGMQVDAESRPSADPDFNVATDASKSAAYRATG